jgi:hypothetical protein
MYYHATLCFLSQIYPSVPAHNRLQQTAVEGNTCVTRSKKFREDTNIELHALDTHDPSVNPSNESIRSVFAVTRP